MLIVILAGALGVSIVVLVSLLAWQRVKIHRLQREQTRRRGAELAEPIVEAMTDVAATFKPSGEIIYLNKAGRRMLGIPDSHGTPQLNLVECCPPWASRLLTEEAIPAAIAEGSWSGETAILDNSGKEVPLSQVIVSQHSRGNVEVLSTIARDIREKRLLESELLHVATHDSLTNLLNRRRFEEELDQQIVESKRYGSKGAVLFLDIDGLKPVNDSLGHLAGDQVLLMIASVLRRELRESEVISRWGGDEFAAIVLHSDEDTAQSVAERLLKAIREEAVIVNGEAVHTTVSIGVAMIPDDGSTVEELLVSADLALYQAKARRNFACVYSSNLDSQTKMNDQRVWEQRIREGLEKDRFVLYGQPIRDMKGEIYRYELLLRLLGDDGDIVAPGIFLPTAERSGLIHAVDRWVVKRAISLIADQRELGRDLRLSVNLSGKAFADPELLPLLQTEMERTKINPDNLVLEITESAAISDLHNASQFMRSLNELGLKFAIDDFGVGFSSFFYLKRLPVDYLKIDGSFIRNLPRDATDQHLVRSMVELARGLNKKTIAEFVGDLETVKLLRDYGVDYVQGYFVGEPRSIWDILARLKPSGTGVAETTGATDGAATVSNGTEREESLSALPVRTFALKPDGAPASTS
ncbi:MAG: EAL domain-containing protein [Dehalococcoidia bacterium]